MNIVQAFFISFEGIEKYFLSLTIYQLHMNEERELKKVQNLLELPVTGITEHSNYVELISDTLNIGTLPIYRVSGVIKYDTDNSFLFRLNWDGIYKRDQSEIDQKIYDLLEKEEGEISITVGTFKTLYVKDQQGTTLGKITCSFDGDKWNVTVTPV